MATFQTVISFIKTFVLSEVPRKLSRENGQNQYIQMEKKENNYERL